jgi:5-(carboxyamino)imidazole ribonucleotide mutase
MSPLVGIVMGSRSDDNVMKAAKQMLEQLQVPCEYRVVSAHRTPDLMFQYAATAVARGLKVIIAGAGGAAHLPGMIASKTILPVVGVPIKSRAMRGMDSLLSIVQMPRGVPVATMAIDGAANAALMAVRILAVNDPSQAEKLRAFSEEQARLAAAPL